MLLLCGCGGSSRDDRAADEATDQRANSDAAVATSVTAPHLLGAVVERSPRKGAEITEAENIVATIVPTTAVLKIRPTRMKFSCSLLGADRCLFPIPKVIFGMHDLKPSRTLFEPISAFNGWAVASTQRRAINFRAETMEQNEYFVMKQFQRGN